MYIQIQTFFLNFYYLFQNSVPVCTVVKADHTQHQEMQRKNENHKKKKKTTTGAHGPLIYSICTNELSPEYEKKRKG